jgi:D-glycero-D-manno-heptose 1,7-bisphosphate phosphatase
MIGGSGPRPAVFLDRDDTLIDTAGATAGTTHPGDLCDPSDVRLIAGAAEACAGLAQAGYALVVVSNQGCIARGICSLAQVEACNDALRRLLAEAGGRLDGLYFAPHHPGGQVPPFIGEHPWRKPGPGMILTACAELGLDSGGSWLIGDAPRDAQAGIAAGIDRRRCLLIGPRRRFRDVGAAAAFILAGERGAQPRP